MPSWEISLTSISTNDALTKRELIRQKEIINFFGILSTKELQKILKFMIDLEANPGATDNED